MRNALLAVLGLILVAPAAAAGAATTTLADRTITADGALVAVCHARLLASAPGVSVRRVTAAQTGLLRATIAARGDWDLAVFDARSRRLVAAGAAPAGPELAEGFVAKGEQLVLQACRRAGAGTQARLRAATIALAPQPAGGREQVVTVAAATPAARSRIEALGLDLTESGDSRGVGVVLHSAADAATLVRAGFSWTVQTADLRTQAAANAVADARFATRARTRAGAAAAGVPSGRTTYRHLADYEAEMKALAAAHPGLVKLITLPHRSLEGRPILGLEIARDVNAANGQPVFLQLGLHHAREWPSAEHVLEWAYDLVDDYGHDAEITRLVDATRNIIVPIVNVDGFNLSREWPVDAGTLVAGVDLPAQINGLVPISDPLYTAALVGDAGVSPAPGTGFTYKRRNCRIHDGQIPAPGECESLANRRLGTDPNRNYGGFWGGDGAGFGVEDDTYRGAAPFSEPEVQNVRELVSSNQVTTLITNHTFANLVLRPPGIGAIGTTPDEALYKTLGDAMAAQNGYTSQHGYDLYDTSGSTEDWSYYATGGLGFTFEIGGVEFHPPYAAMAAEYARNRAAYLVALRSTADTTRHAVLEGRAQPGTILRAHKAFDSQTMPVLLDFAGTTGAALPFHDVLDSTMTVGDSGRFTWHVNQSTRPGAAAPEAWTITCEHAAGQVYARGQVVIARGERKPLELCSLQFGLLSERRTLAAALTRGLAVRATCSLGCTATANLSVDNATARRLGLARRRSSARVVVARGRGGGAFKGRRRFGVRFTPSARAHLRGVRRLRVRLSATAIAGTTDRRTVTSALTLSR
ncbi:MAG TPA: M14 family zinc carboxypeptidase [Solirubrobacteraceae bacterium]|nr:M14 family zinc carboxypeptidase [Solirubrobacteraceae bacterium]